MIIGLMILVVGLIGQWLLGLFVADFVFSVEFSFVKSLLARGVRSESRPLKVSSRPIAELAGLGCVLGVGLTAWWLFVWSFHGDRLGILPSGFLALIGFASGGPVLIAKLRQQSAENSSQLSMTLPQRQERAVCLFCQVVIGGLFFSALLQTLQTPQKLWDERAIFALKGIVLFEDRSIDSPSLLHADFVQYHPRYPLLLPLAEQNIYALLGRVDDRLSKIVFTMLYCG